VLIFAALQLHVLLLISTAVATYARRLWRGECLFVCAILGSHLLMATLIYGQGRFHAPLEPFLAILGVYGLLRVTDTLRSLRQRGLFATLVP
jgi:hypothetical protein